MDNRGWVPISVIASFNRVRHLTFDVTLVRDVLALSALVEVHGDKVRLRDGGWESFILPDAPVSDVPDVMEQQQQYPAQEEQQQHQGEEMEDGEDDEDVVFVMGKEGEDRKAAVAQRTPREDTAQQQRL